MAKVLVVDDSLSVRKVVERALVAKQLVVVSAASGTEAIAQIEREQPRSGGVRRRHAGP